MKARVVIADLADADAAVIFVGLGARAGERTALKYRDLFRKLYEHLADFPDCGAPRAKLGANIRIGVVSPYIVIYRHIEADNMVIVLRIVHGKRKITGKMLQRQ